MYHWCKGELFDIIAVHQALQQKEKIQDRIGKNEKKKRKAEQKEKIEEVEEEEMRGKVRE